MGWDRRGGVGELWAGGSHVSLLPASKALSFTEALLPFFIGELLWFVLVINVHCVGVLGGGTSGGSGGMNCGWGARGMLFCNSSSEAFLAEKLVDFLIPGFEGSGDNLHGIDSVREPYWYSSVEVVDDDGGVGGGVKFCFDNFEFEFSYVLWEVVIVVDTGIGKPSSGFCGGVDALEGFLEVCDKVGIASEG